MFGFRKKMTFDSAIAPLSGILADLVRVSNDSETAKKEAAAEILALESTVMFHEKEQDQALVLIGKLEGFLGE